MKKFLFLFFAGLLLAACGKTGEEAETRVVVHHFPQKIDRGVLKWDCPVLAGYTDGTVIWRKGWASSVAGLATTNSRNADEVMRKLEALIASYGGKTFTLTDSSDPEITTVWSAGKTLSIRGDWRKPRVLEAGDPVNAPEIASQNEHEKMLWSTLPRDVRETLAETIVFSDPTAKLWHPEKLDVTLMPAGEMLGDAVLWPSHWPQVFTDVPGSPKIQQIELPGRMLDEIMSIVARDGQPQALIVAGERKYAEIRFIFPEEAAWKHPQRGWAERMGF